MRKLNKLIIIFFLLLGNKVMAGKLTGKITDEAGVPVPFTLVVVTGTTNGTTANSEGMYTLELADGNYDITFRMIGYSLIQRKVVMDKPVVSLDIKLPLESFNLKEVHVRANVEDPAYEIIRKAQDKRKFYRDQVLKYSTHAYVKSTQRLDSYPKKVLGQNVNIGDVIDTVTKIFYLSESVSELSFKAPDKYKENMISSKVSGEPKTYSFNQSTDVLLSFYDNLVSITGLTPRGIVSPIAGDALFYYKYKLEGSFVQNGVTVNKISVIPKRKNDPVFTGTIYIADSSWRIYSADLFVTKNQQLEFVDTFRVKQNFVKVNDDVWMPFTSQFNYAFSFLGFVGDGVVIGIFSDYNLYPFFKPGFFNGEVMRVEANANERDTNYWSQSRPVPLTVLEETDYKRKDSTRVIHESKEYLDSVDKASNKFSALSLFTAYTWNNSYKNRSITISSPVQHFYFNTVEGWNLRLDADYTKGFGRHDSREWSIKPSIRYGFSNTHFNGHVLYSYRYKPKTFSEIEVDAGTDVAQINNKNPISEFVNSLYSLLAEKNYMKIYEKKYFSIHHRSELFNGFSLNVGLNYSRRHALVNTTNYKLRSVSSRDYTSNDPYYPSSDDFRFPDHNAFIGEAAIAFKPGQEYIERPNERYRLGSKYPTFRIQYRGGIDALNSDVNYNVVQGVIDDDMNFGLFGTFNYMIIYGGFLNHDKLYAMDLRHFNGNKTFLSDFRLDDFKNLDYYAYSTTSNFFEAHAEHNFGGFFLNKIPLIRKLRLQEIAGVHFLHTAQLDRYFEFSVGVEKLHLLRAEIFTSLANGKKGTIGFLFGLKTAF